jgi:hypothetical protein
MRTVYNKPTHVDSLPYERVSHVSKDKRKQRKSSSMNKCSKRSHSNYPFISRCGVPELKMCMQACIYYIR